MQEMNAEGEGKRSSTPRSLLSHFSVWSVYSVVPLLTPLLAQRAGECP